MEYNTIKDHLTMPEYGRHVQNMINHAISLKKKQEQQDCVDAIIAFMGQMNPHLRDVKEFTHKLWDHLHIMSGFQLEVKSPYPKPQKEKLVEKPEPMQYPGNKIRFSYYGISIPNMIEIALKMEGIGERRRSPCLRISGSGPNALQHFVEENSSECANTCISHSVTTCHF